MPPPAAACSACDGVSPTSFSSVPPLPQAADVAVLELREGTFEFLDNYENKRAGRQRLFPAGTVLGGKRVPRA